MCFHHSRQKAPSAKRRIQTEDMQVSVDWSTHSSESAKHPKISHVIPYRNIADRGQKPRIINDPPSNIERSDRELRATFSNNPAISAPKRALRQCILGFLDSLIQVRKHRAPNGALRLSALKRLTHLIRTVRKQRAPKGALRPVHSYSGSSGRPGVRRHRAHKVH